MKITTRIATIAVAAALMVSLGSPASAGTLRSLDGTASAADQVRGSSVKPTAVWGWCAHNTINTGVPTACFYKDVQGFILRDEGYTGAIDGVMGTNSWKAMQRHLKKWGGYKGAIDGIAGPATKKSLQTLLKKTSGYTGPIDGILGQGTYRAWAGYVTQFMD